MSKYKAGDKFIIEIGTVGANKLNSFDGKARYYIKGFNTLVFDDNGLDKLEKADTKSIAETFADYIEEVKKLAYESGIEKGRAEEWNKMSVENAKQTERADALLEASENLAEKLVEKDEELKRLFDENTVLRARLAKVQEVAKGDSE